MKKLIILTIITAIGFGTMGAKDRKMYRNSDYPTLLTVKNRLAAGFDALRTQVIKEPQGFIKYPYLIPAGFYSQLWDWDAYFFYG